MSALRGNKRKRESAPTSVLPADTFTWVMTFLDTRTVFTVLSLVSRAWYGRVKTDVWSIPRLRAVHPMPPTTWSQYRDRIAELDLKCSTDVPSIGSNFLTRLRIQTAPLEGDIITYPAPALTHLSVPRITAKDAAKITWGNIVHCRFTECRDLAPSSLLTHVCREAVQLSKLHVARVTTEQFEQLCLNHTYPKVVHLRVRFMWEWTPRYWKLIREAFPNLNILCLQACMMIDDTSIRSNSEDLPLWPRLHVLEITSTLISVDGLRVILDHTPSLEKLRIKFNARIHVAALYELLHLPQYKHIRTIVVDTYLGRQWRQLPPPTTGIQVISQS